MFKKQTKATQDGDTKAQNYLGEYYFNKHDYYKANNTSAIENIKKIKEDEFREKC